MTLQFGDGRRWLAVVAQAAILASLLGACGDAKSSGSGAGGSSASPSLARELKSNLKIAFLPKQVNNLYFAAADAGGKAAVEEFSGVYREVGPNSATEGQAQFVAQLVRDGQNAIVTSAQDPSAMCDELKRAMAAKVAVVTYDSDTNQECRNIFVNQASAEAIGRTEIKLLAKQLNYEGEIAILSAAQSATNQNTWIKYMQEELTKSEYSKMKLVKIAYGDDDAAKSTSETQALLRDYPNLKGIIAPTTVGIKAAAQYVSASAMKGKVQVSGLGTPNDMRAYVKDGTVQAFELWEPSKLGALAAYAAAALASGMITGAKGESFEAGDLGEYTIAEKGEVVLGDPAVFNAQNIDKFDF
jgi:rhamnose transport system substrate-binding protein